MGLTTEIALIANQQSKNINKRLVVKSKEMMTGIKDKGEHLVASLKADQNESTARVLASVAESANYGKTLVSTVISQLEDVDARLNILRENIAQAETAEGDVLKNFTRLYQTEVASIISLLANAEFGDLHLFNGSLTNGTTNGTPGLPSNPAPLSIRIGDTFNYNAQIVINKLLSGNTNAQDTATANVFTPLFPTTASTTDAGAIATAVATAGIDTNGNIVAAINASTKGYDAVISALLATTPTANNSSNSLNDLVYTIVQEATSPGTNGNPPSQANLDALGGADAIEAAVRGNIAAILSNAAVSIANQSTPVDSTYVKNAIAASVNSFFSAGTLFTQANRKAADGVIVAAKTTITSLISSLYGQKAVLDESINSMNTLIFANRTAASNLLDLDLDEVVTDFKNFMSLEQRIYYVISHIDRINQLISQLLSQ